MAETLTRAAMRDRLYYTVGTLGKSRKLTPEGFLLVEGAAIARVGTQVYSDKELPLQANDAGEIRVERTPEEVFRPETIASFEGKSITVGHPEEFVGPDNWKKYSVGTMQNVRRGAGIEDDLLLADLLITSADAIAYANESLPELSGGYEADYQQIEAGRAAQKNIIGNHVALVERGRAGPRCSIKDSNSIEDLPMTTKTKRNIWARIRTAVKANDMEAVNAEIAEAEASGATPESEPTETQISRKEFTDFMAATNTALGELKTLVTKTNDKRRSRDEGECEECGAEGGKHSKDCSSYSADSETNVGTTYTGDQLKEIVSRAEILSPGIQIPTGDALKTKDAAPQLMLSALEKANATEGGATCVKPFLLGREIKSLTGDALLGAFNGAAELMRVRNNNQATRSSVTTKDFGKATTVASINTANRDFWNKQR